MAVAFSYLFHPLLTMTYLVTVLLLVNPYQFGVNTIGGQWKLIALVFLSTFVLPAIALAVMRGIGMISSLELEDRHERIGPYLIASVFYLWIFINFKNNTNIPASLTAASLGATIALSGVFFFNNFTKISAHAAGMGGLTAAAAIQNAEFSFGTFTLETWVGVFETSTNLLLMVIILLSGAVCSFRLYLKAHSSTQIYSGFAVGFLSQFIALWFIKV